MAGNNNMAIKSLSPPLFSDDQFDQFMRSVEDGYHLFKNEKGELWPQGLKIAARALGKMV
jgi:hypothetical protein